MSKSDKVDPRPHDDRDRLEPVYSSELRQRSPVKPVNRIKTANVEERDKDARSEQLTTKGSKEISNKDAEITNNEKPNTINEDDENNEMAKIMGFTGFGSTKGKKVKGNKAGAVSKPKSGSFRQYMNREKGFNRPLSPPPGEKRKK